MQCPKCESMYIITVNSRHCTKQNAVRRRRQCSECNHRFNSYEIIQNSEYDLRILLKSEGSKFPLETVSTRNYKYSLDVDAFEMANIKKSLDRFYILFGLQK